MIGLGYIVYHHNYVKGDKATLLKLLSYLPAVLLMLSFAQGLGGVWQSSLITYKNAVLWPLIAANMSWRTTKQSWAFIARGVAFVAIAMSLLGSKQFLSAPTSWINEYAWTSAGLESPVATFGGITGVRATGTFSYISGMSEFAVFSFIICLYHLSLETKLLYKLLLIGGCSAAIGCSVESGSRASIAVIGLAGIATFICNLADLRELLITSLLFGLSVTIGFWSLDSQVREQYLNRWTMDPSETLRRFTNEGLRGNYWQMLCANPIGIGLGQGNGYAIFANSQSKRSLDTNSYDDGASIAIYEAGLLGLVAFYLAPFVLGLKVLSSLTNRAAAMRMLAATLAVVPTIGLIAGVWHDHNSTAFTWLEIGIWFCVMNDLSSARGLQSSCSRGNCDAVASSVGESIKRL
jgi:hypothetical protein